MVEPARYYYDQLERVEGVCYENVAIAEDERRRVLYRLDEKSIPQSGENEWMHGIGTLLPKEQHEMKAIRQHPRFDSFIVEEEVECMTLNALIMKHRVKKIDFLKVDAEGYDCIILKSYDFRIKPDLIKVEYKHCGEDGLREILDAQGYHVYKESMDLYANRL